MRADKISNYLRKLSRGTHRDVTSVACYRSTQGIVIARRIQDVCGDGAVARAVADKILACNRATNVWTGVDLQNGDGELYEAAGTLWACGERLCPNCLSARSRRARKRVRLAIQRVVPVSGERWRFITLTMPTLPAAEVPLLTALEVQARAWRLFRKRQWCAQLIRAGVKGVEFTLGNKTARAEENREWMAELDGYHVHTHLLILSEWVHWRTLREEWSTCLLTAWREQGIEKGINTADGLAVCDVRLVTDRDGKKGTISLENAINEVAKYITKSVSWLQVPESQLAEIAAIERWPRMMELLGECRERTSQQMPSSVAKSGDGNDRVVDPSISIEQRLSALLWGDGRDPAIRLWAKACGELKSESMQLQEETRAALLLFTAYLDTQGLSDGESARDGPIVARKSRGQSLRSIGAALIARGEHDKWRELLGLRVAEVKEFRQAQQSLRYPFAKFTSLDGRTWEGVRYLLSKPTYCEQRRVAAIEREQSRLQRLLACVFAFSFSRFCIYDVGISRRLWLAEASPE